uniref:Uncharacterized protein n=1 Tax=Anguilla anguilla TaxID=7936 RepID=A0A0E9R636_ANGAN
MCTSVLTCP